MFCNDSLKMIFGWLKADNIEKSMAIRIKKEEYIFIFNLKFPISIFEKLIAEEYDHWKKSNANNLLNASYDSMDAARM